MTPPLLLEHLDRQVRTRGWSTALRHHSGADWQRISWEAYGRAVDEIAAFLVAQGVGPGDRVALLAGNRPEWHQVDLGILAAGAVSVPVYPTSSSTQIAYVVGHAGARVCFVDTPERLAKVLLRAAELPALERVVLFDGIDGVDDHGLVVDLGSARRTGGAAVLAGEVDLVARRQAITADDVATLVYTSGTTGPPKGTELTHGNLAHVVDAVLSLVPVGPDDRFLSFLPLSHIAERVTSHLGQVASGAETWFAQSLATLPTDLAACRPTVFFAVPRVWEKFRDAALAGFAELPRGLGDRIVGQLDLAATGSARTARERLRRRLVAGTVGRLVRRRLGLDHAWYLASGAAPIDPSVLDWFAALGLTIGEVYGQTEDCGPATVNPPGAIRVGTVGRPIPGLEVRIAADGEIQVRGTTVCRGYHDDPVATAALFTDDGWMCTGDVGELVDGYLRITGRKKELIITAAGKNIAPLAIETALSAHPLISQAVVVGDARPYLTALIALSEEALVDWAHAHGRDPDLAKVTEDPELLAEVQAIVEEVNGRRSRAEGVKRFRLLPGELTMANGELTPTLKVKRGVVLERHGALVEAMYD